MTTVHPEFCASCGNFFPQGQVCDNCKALARPHVIRAVPADGSPVVITREDLTAELREHELRPAGHGQHEKPAEDSWRSPTSHPRLVPENAEGAAPVPACVRVLARDMSFYAGSVIACVWRAGLEGNAIESLQQAAWYLEAEITRLRRQAGPDEGLP